MSEPATLVCFAVKEEAKYFKLTADCSSRIRILVTGMGKVNSSRAVLPILDGARPALVISCGFAGGLDPALESGAVIFRTAGNMELEAALLGAGARRATFHCAERVLTTVLTTEREKRVMRQATGADAVEMESGVIWSLCQERQIPCAIVRVILDTAREDLPLDFNVLLRADQSLDMGKLLLALLKSPGRIGGLLRLQRRSADAARRLAQVLTAIVPP
jgi:adenosylhomocysteine nucleosidase